MNEIQRQYSLAKDEEDRAVLLRATLDFLGITEEERVINKRELPPELEELVGELERTLQVPVICRVVKK